MEAKLIGVEGFGDQGEVALSPTEAVVLGRGKSATVQFAHSKMSRLHCRIAFENGFYRVEDLESKNGTWVNNRKIHKVILFHQDRITIGGAEFRFVLAAGITEESSDLAVEDADLVFTSEIKEPADVTAASSLFLEIPKAEELAERPGLERDLSELCNLINNVNAEHHLDRLLETIMDSVMEVSNADRGYLIAARSPNGVLMPLVSRNKENLPTYARSTFSRSIVTECYESNTSILRADPRDTGEVSESIVAQQIQSIMCVPMRDEHGPVGVVYVDSLLGSRRFAKHDLKVLTAIGSQAGIAIRRAQLSRQVESLFRDSMRTVINLVEIKDEYTYGHSERVTALSMRIGELCSLRGQDIRDLELAGLLHDVGKLAVRLDILKKPDSLTASEYQAVKRHPITGAAILDNVDNAERIANAIRHHHERWDGTGYPDELKGEDIPVLARILALADTFDSMASERPYKGILPREEILRELENVSGQQLDPTLVKLFVDALRSDEAFINRINVIYRQRGTGTKAASAFD